MCLDCNGLPAAAEHGRSAYRPSAARSPALTPAQPPVLVDGGLKIFPRSVWAGEDRPPVGELYPEQVQFLLVHHSAGPNEYTESDAIGQMQTIYSLHTGPDKSWPDVCYNFFIDRFGRVFEARAGSLAGPVMADATGGSQGFAQLVCLLGDFTEALPTAEAIDALTKTLTWLSVRHRLPVGPNAATTFVSRGSNRWPEGESVTANTISGHRDMSQTACPGDTFYPFVTTTLRSDVAARVATAPPTPQVTGSSVPTSVIESSPASAVPPSSAVQLGSSAASPPVTTQAAGPETTGIEVGSGAGSGRSDLLAGGIGGVGVVGLAAGLGWVIKRRIANGR